MRNFVTLFRYEWKKLWGHKIVITLLLCSCLFMVGSMLAPYFGKGYEYRYDAEDFSVERVPAPYLNMELERKEYMSMLSGQVLDADLMEQLSRNYADSTLGTKQWNLNEYTPFRYLNMLENHSDASVEEYYHNNGFWNYLSGKGATEEEISYWKGKLADKEPIVLDYCGGWYAILEHSQLLSLLTMLVVGIGLCPVFSEEHKIRMDQLALSSQNGGLPLFLAKFSVGAIFAVLVPVVLSLAQLLPIGILLGLNGFSAPLQLWADGGGLWNCSIGQYSLLMVVLLILSAIMLAALVFLVSEATHSAIVATMIPFALGAVPLLGLFSQPSQSIARVINYLPTIRIGMETLGDYRLVQLGGIQLNCLEFTPMLYFLFTVLFAVFCWNVYRRCQVTGK